LSEARSGRKVVVLLLPVAALVAAGLVAIRLHYEPPTIPPYWIAEPAGAGQRAMVLTPGASFRTVLRPASAVKGAIAARGFLVRGTEVRPWSASPSVSLDGSVTIDGRVDALFAGVPAGAWDVAVAVGRPEVLPTAPRDVTRPRDEARPSAWRLLEERVVLAER
jgi:hypothetical protein